MSYPIQEAPIDLHVHTTFSDGTLTPAEVVRLAGKSGLRAVAITDHDTVRGNQQALEEGKRVGTETVPGVEISVDVNSGTMHVLGYYVDFECATLIQVLERIETGRHRRNEDILGKLRDIGIPLDYNEVKSIANEGPVGRPHIAQILVQHGHVRDTREAFDKYLKKGAPAYAERLRFSEGEAIRTIHEAGGIAVLSHPSTLRCNDDAALEGIIKRLVETGLEGIEVYYPSHTPEMRRTLERLAVQYGLLVTGGTDFHGAMDSEISIGTGYGDLHVPYSLLQAMKARLDTARTNTAQDY